MTTGAACGDRGLRRSPRSAPTPTSRGAWSRCPTASILYTRRDAHDIVRLDPATGAKTTVGTVPNVQSTDGEGGLLGLAHLADLRHRPAGCTSCTPRPTDNRIVRIKLREQRARHQQPSRCCSAGSCATSTTTAAGCGSARTASCTPPPATPRTATTRRTRTTSPARSCGSTRTAPCRRTTRSATTCGATATATRRASRSTRRAGCGSRSSATRVMDETNLITKGGNYGWPACEGTVGTCGTAGFIAPKRTYPTVRGLVLRHRDRPRRALRRLRARRPDVPRGHQRQLA